MEFRISLSGGYKRWQENNTSIITMIARRMNYKIVFFFSASQGAEVSKTCNNLKSRKRCYLLTIINICKCFNNWFSSEKRNRIRTLTGIEKKNRVTLINYLDKIWTA